ncbi:MAG: hypothetical protein KA140_02665 [Caldisericia bacterium]|nr:hypothetical protein [Caldisericia bacterium]
MKNKIMVAFLAVMLTVSCGVKPQVGGFLKIKIADNPEAMVSIDDAQAVPYSKLEQPLDLMAIPHKIAITWPQTGQTTVEFVSVVYGQTVEFEPKLPSRETVGISSSMPGTILVGNTELGHSSKIDKADVYAGENTFEVRLDGFSYVWTKKANVELGTKIMLEPGTDDKHGALYIKSESPGVEFIIVGTEEKQRLYQGSSFVPNIVPGRLEITEKSSPGVKQYVQIEVGKVTKINFSTSFQKKEEKLTTIESFGKTTLYVCWSTQTTEIDLTGKTKISEYDLDKLTLFRPGTMNSRDVFKFFVSQDDSSFGVASVIGAMPDKVVFQKGSGTMLAKPEKIAPDIQNWLPQSPDGKWTVNSNMIYGPGGYKFDLKDFMPGCWDLKNYSVLVTKVDVEAKTFEIRETPLSKMNPMVLGTQTYEPIGQKGLDWVNAFAFYDKSRLPLGVVSSSKWTSIFTRSTSADVNSPMYVLEKNVPMPSTSCSLADRRFLICRKTREYFGNSFIYDLQTDNIYDDLANPTLTENGLIACNLASGANAGIIYKISGKTLVPVWAGLY